MLCILQALSQRLRCSLGVDLGSALCILTGILEVLLQESLYHILRSIVLELLYFVLVWGFRLCGLWDLSSLGDQTHAPCSGNVESYPLDRQGSPWRYFEKFPIYL